MECVLRRAGLVRANNTFLFLFMSAKEELC